MIAPATEAAVQDDVLERAACERRRAHEDWADFIARNLCHFSIRSRREASFQIGARVRTADEFLVGRFKTVAGSAELDRRPEEIRIDGQDRYAITLPLQGEHALTQARRDTRCRPFSINLMTMSEPLVHTKLGDNDTVYLFMPRDFVDQRFAGAIDICSRAVDARHGVQRLAHDSLIALQHEAAAMPYDVFQAATRMMGELFLLALGGAGELMSDASSIRAANLARVKRVMRSHLADQDLALGDVAQECGLSLRYLHDLFRDDGRTASEFLRSERLQRARRMLENAATRTITDVSMRCGFSSPSQFATAFRRAYGMSPRDVKRRS